MALALPLAFALPATAAPADPAAAAVAGRVEISGSAQTVDARDATASRQIVSREEISRHGDASVVDVLRRVPGITVINGQGRAADIRLRGLGSGYTQILVNGEVMPAGFSLESLPPSQIERIEVARVATVDVGAQAIAGTIDIVLRQVPRQPQRELKAAVASHAGRGALQLDGQWAGRHDGLGYTLGAGLSRRNETWPTGTTQDGSDAGGTPGLSRRVQRLATGLADSVSLTPKLTQLWGEQERLGVEVLLRHNRFDDHARDQRSTLLGAAPSYSSDTQTLALRTTLAQGRLNWTRPLAGGATLDLRLGANQLRRASDTHLLGQDEAGRLAMDERVTSSTHESGLLASGKLRLPYTAGHAIALGWDGEHTRRDETRVQRQASPTGRTTQNLDERYRTTVGRLAAYVQDEWDLDEHFSAYAGLRWAGLHTRSEGAAMAPAGTRSAVLSPVLQMLWKPPALAGDQLRLALSRTYKAPRAVDLIPRRFVAIENTPTSPNVQGNPLLRPELAWGLDLAFEHALPRKMGDINLNATWRRIRDVTLEQLFLDQGAWVARKVNAGAARVWGLELESRLALRAVQPQWPDIDLRASVSRNHSAVDSLPGPDNRLDGQIPLSASLGLDWRVAGLPLTAGASLAHRGGLRARSSATLLSSAQALDTLDLYLLWKCSPQAQLRLAVANALAPHDIGTDQHQDAAGRFTQTTDAPTAPTLRLGLELKL